MASQFWPNSRDGFAHPDLQSTGKAQCPQHGNVSGADRRTAPGRPGRRVHVLLLQGQAGASPPANDLADFVGKRPEPDVTPSCNFWVPPRPTSPNR